jgi:hypothetical protein
VAELVLAMCKEAHGAAAAGTKLTHLCAVPAGRRDEEVWVSELYLCTMVGLSMQDHAALSLVPNSCDMVYVMNMSRCTGRAWKKWCMHACT